MTNAIVADLAGRERLDSRRAGPRVRGRGAEGNAAQERFEEVKNATVLDITTCHGIPFHGSPDTLCVHDEDASLYSMMRCVS